MKIEKILDFQNNIKNELEIVFRGFEQNNPNIWKNNNKHALNKN